MSMTREQILADPVAAVDALIAEAEQYKRERDEAVEMLRRLSNDDHIAFYPSAIEIGGGSNFDAEVWKRDAEALLARVALPSSTPH